MILVDSLSIFTDELKIFEHPPPLRSARGHRAAGPHAETPRRRGEGQGAVSSESNQASTMNNSKLENESLKCQNHGLPLPQPSLECSKPERPIIFSNELSNLLHGQSAGSGFPASGRALLHAQLKRRRVRRAPARSPSRRFESSHLPGAGRIFPD